MWRRVICLMTVAMMLTGCGGGDGEVRDRAEDCRSDQYFDEGGERCRSCPAAVEPTCKPGCGFDVERDHLDCPVLTCESGCKGCPEGERWNGEEERCEVAD